MYSARRCDRPWATTYVSIREGRAKPLFEPPSVLRMGRRSDLRHIVTLMRHAHITLFVHTHTSTSHSIIVSAKPYRHGTSPALRLCTCALLECCQPLLRCRTLPRRVDDGCLGGCCFGGCLGGSRLTPLSLLSLALWTRTLAAISLTISQRLLLLAALRQVLLVLVVRLETAAITQRRHLARRLAVPLGHNICTELR